MNVKQLADKVRGLYCTHHALNGAIDSCAQLIEKELENYTLVPIEDCLLCKNTGIFGMGVGDAYDANTSCVCVSKPQSRYNVNKTMLSAVKEKE